MHTFYTWSIDPLPLSRARSPIDINYSDEVMTMEKKRGQIHEKDIWEMYEKKCRQEGTTPSIEDFKKWTRSLLANL